MGTVGDLPPDGGRTFFDAVDQELRGDVVLGNLEGTLSTGGSSKCGDGGSPNCFAFQAPPSYARWFARAGFTVLNLANNHSFDFGATGLRQTVRALDRHGLKHTGRPGEIAYVDAGPVRVALIGFASYSWSQSLLDLRAARRIVQRADQQADIVVATFHGGAEGAGQTHVPHGTEWFLGENRGNLRAFSHTVVDAGADLVVGHGPHVLRGMEWYKGRLIAYSLGNFAGYGVFSMSGALGISGVLRVTLKADGSWAGGRLVPTQMVGRGTPALDGAERAHGIVRTLSREDFGARGARVTPEGRLLRPA
jgi:poly-gamma-glutamate capsule biosynthesis protein CapA/YwtB (metallophosphatase superfamily)